MLGALALAMAPAQANPQALTFDVESTLEESDASPGDGTCASTPSGLCTPRAAVREANLLVGGYTIALQAGSYVR